MNDKDKIRMLANRLLDQYEHDIAAAYAAVSTQLLKPNPGEELLAMKRELEHRIAEEMMEEWGWERTDTGHWKKIESDTFWERWKAAKEVAQ